MIGKWLAATLVAAGTLAPCAQAAPNGDYRIVDRIAGPDGGWDFANVDAAGNRLYVAHGDAVMTVDLASRTARSLATARHAHQVLPIPGTDEIFETDGDTGLTRFLSARNGAVIAEVPTGAKPDAAFFDAVTGLVVVMNAGDGTLALIDPKSHRLAGKITVGGGLEFGVADGKGGAFVNIEDRNALVAVDLRTRRVTKTIALTGCEGPTGLALIGHGTRLISACANHVVVVTDPQTGKVLASLPIGADPDAVLVDEARQRAFIPCGGDGTLAVLDISDADHIRLLGSVATQVGAKTGALDPRDGRIYLPTATLAPPEPGAHRGKPIPGSFVILVLAPTQS